MWGRGYFEEGDHKMVALVIDLALETGEIVHDEGLLSRVDEVERF
jgi:hypothetical protein